MSPVAHVNMVATKLIPSSATRIRDNQRRSRARRKDYLHELEERVREFERLGVQASVELQVVAKKVTRENTALRALLLSRGVTPWEIEACTQLEPENIQQPTSRSGSDIATKTGPCYPLPQRPLQNISLQPAESQSTAVDQQRHGSNLATEDSSISYVPSATSEFIGKSRESRVSLSSPSSEGDIQCPTSSTGSAEYADRSVPVKHGTHPRKADEDDATSCETAAYIIANLRGHDDTNKIRAELGCTSAIDCNVKNLTVFDAMDR